MKITRRQLSRLINENLGRALDEGSRYTGGVQQGATVWLKGDPDRGKGVVRGAPRSLATRGCATRGRTPWCSIG